MKYGSRIFKDVCLVQSLDFIYYDDESEDEDAVAATENSYDISCNFVDCMMNRQRGDHR